MAIQLPRVGSLISLQSTGNPLDNRFGSCSSDGSGRDSHRAHSMRRIMMRRALLIVPLAAAAILLPASPAAADHTHFRVVGDGECVLLAPDGGEKYVHLPNADEFP